MSMLINAIVKSKLGCNKKSNKCPKNGVKLRKRRYVKL
jgi:hypothetical protein